MSRAVPVPAYDLPLRGDRDALAARLAGARHVPFWLDDPARPAARPALAGDARTDLLVVGAGFCGLWTALAAARAEPGRRVLLLDAGRVGWAASGRNGGFAEPSLTHGPDNGRRWFADELDLLDRLAAENFEGFVEDVTHLGGDVGLVRGGTLQVATEPHQVSWLREQVGPGERLLVGPALDRLIRSPLYRAGLLAPEGALVNPARLAWALADAAVAAGVELAEHTPVLRLRDAGPEVVASTSTGQVRARQAVLATNGFRPLLVRNRLRTIPVHDYVLVTEPLTAAQREEIGWRGTFGVADSGRQFHYSRLTDDGRILWGGYDAVYFAGGRVSPDGGVRPETFLRLADHLTCTFPLLADVGFSHAWGGMIDMSSRLTAFHGTAMGGKVAYSAGFTGLGVVATRFAASVMLDLLAGRDTPRTRTRLVRTAPRPIPPEPFATPAVLLVKDAIARSDRNGGRDGLVLRAADLLGYAFDS